MISTMVMFKNYAFADVPVRDSRLADQELEHNTFGVSYLTTIVALLDNLANATDYAAQATDMSKLIELQQELSDKCDKSCNPEEFKQVHEYLNKLNQNFADKFKATGQALKNGSNSIKSIQEFITKISIMGGGRVKTAALTAAMQQAALKTEQEMQMVLMQMQAFFIQQEQKKMLEIKIERANVNTVYAGFHNSGL